jgi:ABC-type branched-subunit amino acid transport system substrate-binding protein
MNFRNRSRSGLLTRVALASVMAAGSLVVVGLTAGGTAGAAKAKSPFIIGADESFSGALAAYGGWIKDGFSATFNAVNKSGGIDGHKIDLKTADDQFTLSTSISNMKELLAEKPVYVTGSTLTTFCAGNAPLARKAKVPMSCFATLANQVNPVQPYLFDRNPPEITTAQPLVNFIPTVVTSTPKIGILVADIPGPDAFATQVGTLAKAKGWSVTTSVTSPGDGTPPTAAQVAAIVATDPNVVVMEIASSENAAFVEDLRTDGFTGPVISQDADYDGLLSLADPNYYSMTANRFVTTSSASSGAKSYVKEMGTVGVTGNAALNSGVLAQAWITAQDLVAALKNCVKANKGNCTGPQLDVALDSTKVSLPGLVTTAGYTKTNHVLFSSQYIYGYRASSGVTEIEGPLAMAKA